jgi:predicted dehydrogenase
MEKPMGTDWRRLDALAVKAATEQVWTSVALVSRYYGLIEALGALRESGQMGAPCHYYHSLFAGSPLRYTDWGVGWMLDPKLAGAGPLWNFGPHVVDLFLHLVDPVVKRVTCWTHNRIYGLGIEDIASIRMEGASGVVGIGEVSYTMPSSYQRFFSLTTERIHCGGEEMGSGEILVRDADPIAFSGADTGTVYETYVMDTLRRFEAGESARATIDDMAAALRVMEAARTSAQTGEPVELHH